MVVGSNSHHGPVTPLRVRAPGLQMRTFVCYAEEGRLAETLRAMRVKAIAATRMKAA